MEEWKVFGRFWKLWILRIARKMNPQSMAEFKEDDLKRIKKWFDKLKKSDKALGRTGKGAIKKFEEWLDKPENVQYDTGIRTSSVGKCRQVFKDTLRKKPKEIQRWAQEDVDEKIEKTEDYIEAVTAYIEWLKDGSNARDKLASDRDINNVDFDWEVPRDKTLNLDEVDLEECKLWFFYYLDLRSDKIKSLPKIGRAIVQVFDDNKVHFYNIPPENNQNYSGRWYAVKKPVYSFNLRNDSKDQHLHLKVEFKRRYQILTGNYTTFDGTRIYSGRFIGERITTAVINQIKKNTNTESAIITSALFDYRQSLPDGGYPLNKHIFEFLAEKHQNHLSTSDPSLDLLDFEKFLKKRSPVPNPEKRERWYVDYPEPTMFISTPQTALIKNDEDEDALIKQIEKKQKLIDLLVKRIGEEIPDIQPIQERTTKESKITSNTFDSLNVMRKARYFVLILGDVNKATYAMVQLGWSLSYVKHLIIFYKDGNLSNRMESLTELSIDVVAYKSLTNDLEKIVTRIKKFVEDRDKMLT